MDSDWGLLESKATSLLTEPQPLKFWTKKFPPPSHLDLESFRSWQWTCLCRQNFCPSRHILNRGNVHLTICRRRRYNITSLKRRQHYDVAETISLRTSITTLQVSPILAFDLILCFCVNILSNRIIHPSLSFEFLRRYKRQILFFISRFNLSSRII